MPNDKLNHRLGIVQPMRMMANARLVINLDRATEFLVASFHQTRILLVRNHVVCISNNVNECDLLF
jgi:hypothetical protein